MSKYDGLSDKTFMSLIENDFEEIEAATGKHVSLVHSTGNDEPENRRWHVRHHAHGSTVLDNIEVAGFTLGAMTVLTWMREQQCGADFMAGATCILPKNHSGGHHDGN